MANNPELSITGVETTEYRSGIPLQGWESVASALNTYSKGGSRSSRVTRNDLEKNIVEMGGGLGLGLLFLSQGPRSDFVEDMLDEAKAEVDSRGRWERHYDYDGQGVFHKTTVEVKRLFDIKDGYLLGLSAAYVGKAVEDGLAETLGVEQGLQWKSVHMGLTPEGSNQFRINFDQVIDRLQPVVADLAQPKGRNRVSGMVVANYLMGTTEWREQARDFVLGFKDGVEVTLDLGRVERRFDYKNGNLIADNWKQEGPVLTGLLDTDYEDETKFVPPSFVVSMRRVSKEKWDRLPAIDPQMKATMNDLADRIATAFKPAA
jgi:hypothetical protein